MRRSNRWQRAAMAAVGVTVAVRHRSVTNDEIFVPTEEAST